MITAITNLVPTATYLGKTAFQAINEIDPTDNRVVRLALFFFPIGIGLYFIGFGAAELAVGCCVKKEDVDLCKPQNTVSYKVHQAVKKIFEYIPYEKVHGALFVSTGITEMMMTMHFLDYINIPNELEKIAACSEGTFLLANVLMFLHSYQRYYEASELGDSRKKMSARLGILSSLSYIVGTARAMAGSGTASIVLFMVLGLCAGGSKILYDLYGVFKASSRPVIV